jgi:anti-sigma B factor antagonist
MKLQSTTNGDITVISLAGDLNVDSVVKLKDVVYSAFQEQHRDFVLDVKGLTSIDSAGLESLTALQQKCDEQLGMLHLCGADDMLRKIFELTRLDKQFALYSSLEEAIASFAGT